MTPRRPVDLELRELPPGDPAWTLAFDVLRQLRGHLDRTTFDELHAAGVAQGLRFTGAFISAPSGEHVCVGVAGWRLIDTASVIRKLFIDDLVVDGAHRSAGIGRQLLEHLEEQARAHGAHVVELDSGHQRTAAHRFYRRHGYQDVSLKFRKPLDRERGAGR
jgi:ribosomal protein S18 acetylase RimI-like enzyme